MVENVHNSGVFSKKLPDYSVSCCVKEKENLS